MSVTRLLMIDDEPYIGALVRRVAEGLDYEMRFVTLADEFKRTHRSLDPDVVILDLSMPDIDGIELLKFLATEKSRARILILSGFDARILNGARRLGEDRGLHMAGIVSKPVRIAELRTILETLKTTQPDRPND
ncbi:MAG TPA: response regulator [Micropepsaceae bacterium]|jgi:CheY-like chemotaxis protein